VIISIEINAGTKNTVTCAPENQYTSKFSLEENDILNPDLQPTQLALNIESLLQEHLNLDSSN